MRPHIFFSIWILGAILVPTGFHVRAADSPTVTNAPLHRTDARGNPIRRARTGHVSNYDESRVGHYTLPNPLVLENGHPVRDPKTWFNVRRRQLLKLYDDDIYGRVPPDAPKVHFKLAEMDTNALGGLAIHKLILIRFGDQPDGPVMHLNEYLPAEVTWPVPMLLQIVFFSNPPIPDPAVPSTNAVRRFRFPFSEAGPMTNIIERGYGYATFRYTEVQPDSRNSSHSGVIGLTLKPGQTNPPDA